MSEPIAYHNGQFVSLGQLQVAPQDLGFMWGVTVAEQLRTFRGSIFLLEQHLDRLALGLQATGVSVALDEIADAAEHVVRHNFTSLAIGLDLGLTIFVTPGLSPTYSPGKVSEPTVGIHSYPLPFSLWADKYQSGQHCEVSSVRQVPESCWPRTMKARSRLHYYLADQQVRAEQPRARALLLDEAGNVNEASTANVVLFVPGEGLVSPPLDEILPGVSLRFLEKLAAACDLDFVYRRVPAEDLARAEEILLTSTPFCLLPVSRMGARELHQRTQFAKLLSAWSDRVGLDIADQARAASQN